MTFLEIVALLTLLGSTIYVTFQICYKLFKEQKK